jgi:hypothetical protein
MPEWDEVNAKIGRHGLTLLGDSSAEAAMDRAEAVLDGLLVGESAE